MRYEYYYSEMVNDDTWEQFLIAEQKGMLDKSFERITGYGWKDEFGFNYDGRALYVSEHGNKYKGVWFEIVDRRIAVFEVFQSPKK